MKIGRVDRGLFGYYGKLEVEIVTIHKLDGKTPYEILMQIELWPN